MSICFVTGANSFLGGALARLLLAQGQQVRGLVRPAANDVLLRGLPIERVSGDLLQPDSYRSALAGCDAFYHVAAVYTHDPARLAQMEAANVEGVRLALGAALDAGVPRLLHTSTIGVIGQPEDGSLADENTPFNLPDPSAYVRSKRAGEQAALALARAGGHIVIVHPTAMIGPGDWRPSNSGRLLLEALAGRLARYPAGGMNWCPVEDTARGMILALNRGQRGRRYILGHGRGNLTPLAFLRLASAAAGYSLPLPLLRYLRGRVLARLRGGGAPSGGGGVPARLTCNPARAVAELGMPQSGLPAAARAAVAWYRAHGYL